MARSRLQPLMIHIGNFFFQSRNLAFPLIVAGLCLSTVPPVEVFHSTRLGALKDVMAVMVALAGLVLRATVIGYVYIRRGGQKKRIHADGLVTEGLFKLCRNPLYVGNMLIYSGIMLLHGAQAVVLCGIVLFAFIYQCIVLAEEAFLLAKFGESYRLYCAEVPRWIPQFARFRAATAGMRFNIRRVILKDYSTMASTLTGLTVVQICKYLLAKDAAAYTQRLCLLAGFLVLIALIAAIVSRCKKSSFLRELPTS